jgi:5'(3')-deoxyribonucleotidase
MRIALDLDGVCYEWEKTARYMLRRKRMLENQPIPLELMRESDSWDAIEHAVTAAEWAWLWSEGVKEGLFRYGHCCRGAIEGVHALSEIGDVIIVTSRPPSAVRDTLAWLTFMFDKTPLAGIHFTGIESKSAIFADVYIDDGAHNIVSLRAQGKRVIAVMRAWNFGLQLGSGPAAFTWPAIVEEVRKVAKEIQS